MVISKPKVIHRSGVSHDMPLSAPSNELLFIEDIGKIYKGNGIGESLIDFSDILTGFLNMEQLALLNPAIKGKLYLTDDGILAYYNGTNYIPVSGAKDDEEKEEIDLTGYLDKETYASKVNVNNVGTADCALQLQGIDYANPLTYYGKDIYGKVGFHEVPEVSSGDSGTGQGANIEQKVLLDVKQGQTYLIKSKNDMSVGKTIVQAYKFLPGETDVISTVKEFNNGEEENFYCDKDNLVFSEGCSIRTTWEVKVTKNNSLYETDVINKIEFREIKLV